MNKQQMLGTYFGYPKCCTESFINLPVWERSIVQKSVHNNHGFIPCYDCAIKIVNKETTIEELITNRICETPFPHNGTIEQADAFFKTQSDLYKKP